ncbi:hypothetical protein V492_07703 [Pseudogymnoascus sp. VKM F-4246]|nr:hypothetical protein V492_07703 [Pseudogymnoascus sp. VKM F-4246]
MEPPQPPSTRKRKRPETETIFEEKVANLSLDDFPKPPGVNSFGEVDGQKVDIPNDAALAGPSKEDQAPKKRAPVNEEERNELYKLDLSYFKILYDSKALDFSENTEWHIHTHWCRRKFWEHYYRENPEIQYPESPESPESQQEHIREEHANHRQPWWFRGFSDFEHKRAKYPKAWKHYENDVSPPPSPPKPDREFEGINRMRDHLWDFMTNERLEECVQEYKTFCATEKKKIQACTEVVEEYTYAIRDMKRQYVRAQKRVDYITHGIALATDFVKQRRAAVELTSHGEGPERKKRRMK